MHVADGAGLAANQVDVDLRLFVTTARTSMESGMSATSSTRFWTCPIREVRRLIDDFEGCLSVPGAGMAVPAPIVLSPVASTRDGTPLVIEGTATSPVSAARDPTPLRSHLSRQASPSGIARTRCSKMARAPRGRFANGPGKAVSLTQ